MTSKGCGNAWTNLLKCNKGKCKVLHMVRNSAIHWCIVWDFMSWKAALRSPGGQEHEPAMLSCSKKSSLASWLHLEEHCQQVKGWLRKVLFFRFLSFNLSSISAYFICKSMLFQYLEPRVPCSALSAYVFNFILSLHTCFSAPVNNLPY